MDRVRGFRKRSMPSDVAQLPSPAGSHIGWYNYAIVRVVPRVEREEFVNVGVILFARELRFLAARVELDPARIRVLAPAADLALIERHLRPFEAVAAGLPGGGPVAALPQPGRFHWLTAPRSTMIQPSPVHTGSCTDPRIALEELLDVFVRPSQRR